MNIYEIKIDTGIDIPDLYYIGCTKDIENRKKQHLQNLNNGSTAPLYKYLRYFDNTSINLNVIKIGNRIDENEQIDIYTKDEYCVNHKLLYDGLTDILEKKIRKSINELGRLKMKQFKYKYVDDELFNKVTVAHKQHRIVKCKNCGSKCMAKNYSAHTKTYKCSSLYKKLHDDKVMSKKERMQLYKNN